MRNVGMVWVDWMLVLEKKVLGGGWRIERVSVYEIVCCVFVIRGLPLRRRIPSDFYRVGVLRMNGNSVVEVEEHVDRSDFV